MAADSVILFDRATGRLLPEHEPVVRGMFLGDANPGDELRMSTDGTMYGVAPGSTDNLIVSAEQPTPPTGVTVLWVQRLPSGGVTLNLVTGD